MRRYSLVLLVVLVGAMLVACGGGSKSKDSTATTDPPPASTTTPQASATPQKPAKVKTATTTDQGPTPTPMPERAVPDGFAFGFNVAARGDDQGAEFNQKTIDMVKGAGFGWVRIQVQWSELEPQKDQWNPLPLDRVVDQYNQAGVNILATLAKAPDWARDPSGNQFLADYTNVAGVMHFLAERYKGKIQAYEVWNEQNLASEMGGTVRLADYGQMLEAGYNGAKQADPNVTIVFGGLTPTGVQDPKVAYDDVKYLDSFYQFRNGAYTKFFDVLGVHVNATKNAPEKMYPDDPGTGEWTNDPSFYFRRAEQIHDVMTEYGDDRPIWITEFGWTTENAAPGYEYGKEVTEQNQADYLVGAFDWALQNWPWTKGMFVWNLNYSTISPPTDEKTPWSVLNSDWSPRPAYNALKEMPKQ